MPAQTLRTGRTGENFAPAQGMGIALLRYTPTTLIANILPITSNN